MSNFSQEEIVSLCKMLESRIGIVIKNDRLPQIQTIIEEFFKILNITNFQAGYNLLTTIPINDNKFQVLAEKITIGETFFFRDQTQFQALQDVVLPQLIEQHRTTSRPISILSAACSTGEEIYSVAMILQELFPTIKTGQFRLIGGDINGTSLAKARKAAYTRWSFRGVPPSVINKYFSHKDDQYHLQDRIKSMVQFQYLNLAEALPFIDLDLIIMRNVLIYFNNDFIEKLAGRCFNVLRNEGLLLVGTSELNRQNFKQFEERYIKDAVFYRKKQADTPLLDLRLEHFKQVSQTNFDSNLQYKPTNNSFASPIEGNSSKIDSKEPDPNKENKSSKETYKKALQHFENHDFAKAENLLSTILEQETQALLLMAKIAANKGNNSSSESFCRKYLGKEPNSLEGHYLMGLIYQTDNKFNKAAEELRYTVLLDNNFVMGHWNLALIYQKTDDKQASKRHLLQVKKILDVYPPEATVALSEGQKATRILQIVDGMLRNLR